MPRMSPAQYMEWIVLPTLAELLDNPGDQRRAYLACITAAHAIDYLARSGRGSQSEIRTKLRERGGYAAACLAIVEGICNGTKHAGPGRDAAFKFAPGEERYVPAFAWDDPDAGWGSRWGSAGLVADLDHGSYFIDDCVRETIRSLVEAYPLSFEGVDLASVRRDQDRFSFLDGVR